MEKILTSNGKEIPKSPYNLLQEIYISDPWKMMVCCILLNQTKRKQVDQVRNDLFELHPSPLSMSKANEKEIASMIKKLGFSNRRSKTLVRFSNEWISKKDWKNPIELHGIGNYAMDSWKMFLDGEIVDDPSDHVLKDYVKWRKNYII